MNTTEQGIPAQRDAGMAGAMEIAVISNGRKVALDLLDQDQLDSLIADSVTFTEILQDHLRWKREEEQNNADRRLNGRRLAS